MLTELLTRLILGENWSAYDENKKASGRDPALFSGEPWEVQFLAGLLRDAQRHEGDNSVLAAIFLSCAELKPPRQRADFVRRVVDKLFR